MRDRRGVEGTLTEMERVGISLNLDDLDFEGQGKLGADFLSSSAPLNRCIRYIINFDSGVVSHFST
jgi:hypothetical protein